MILTVIIDDKTRQRLLPKIKTTPSNIDQIPISLIYRGYSLIVLFIVAVLLLLGRLADIVLFSAQKTDSKFFNQTKVRKDIIDCNREVLATTLPTTSLYVNGLEVLSVEKCAAKINKVMPQLSVNFICTRIEKHRLNPCILLQRHITPQEANQLSLLALPEIILSPDQKRFYPHGSLFAHVLGVTDIDNMGISGLEKSYDKHLQEYNLSTTIDARVQHVAKEELLEGLEKSQATSGLAVMLDVTDFTVKALVSLPDFNPNIKKELSNMANRVVSRVFEMGSVFKILTAAASLDAGVISLEKQFNITPTYRLGKYTIKDYTPQTGPRNVVQIFAKSSNVGFIQIAQLLGITKMKQFLQRIGFNERLNLDLLENALPLVPKNWSDITLATISYGYGIAITPMHLCAAIASVVNGGEMAPISFTNHKKTYTKIISKEASKKVSSLLRLAILNSGHHICRKTGYMIGGKSSTAHTNRVGKYDKEIIASFSAVFPMHKPRYLLLIMVENPQTRIMGHRTGTTHAAPIATNIITRTANFLGLPPIDEAHEDEKLPLNLLT